MAVRYWTRKSSAQDGLLAADLSELQTQRSGVPDVYSLVWRPVRREDVFVRELSFVKNLFDKQWDSEGLLHCPGQ
jgi:hypothetical protein